jgi:hypothetical protein
MSWWKWILLLILSLFPYFIIREIGFAKLEQKRFPSMYIRNSEGQYVVNEPFWIKHATDGQLIKNRKYTDDETYLNKEGIRMKERLQER